MNEPQRTATDTPSLETWSSRLDLERTVETQVMLDRMCRGTPYRVLVTQTPSAVRSSAELEIDRQIREKLPTFDVQMHMLDAFRAMFNTLETAAAQLNFIAGQFESQHGEAA